MKDTKTTIDEDLFSKEVLFLYQRMNNIYNKDVLNNYKKSISNLLSEFYYQLSVVTEYYYLYYSEEDKKDVELYHFLKNINNSSFIEKDGEKLYLLKKENYEDYLFIITNAWECFFDSIESGDYDSTLFSYYLPKKETFLFDTKLPNNFFSQEAMGLFRDDYYILLKEVAYNAFVDIKNIYIEFLKEIFEKEERIYLFRTDYNFEEKKESLEESDSDIFLVFDQNNILIKKIVSYLSNQFLKRSMSLKKEFYSYSKYYLYCYPISLLANEKNKELFLKCSLEINNLFSEKDKGYFPKELWDFYQKNKV